jgi:hypothetical protein
MAHGLTEDASKPLILRVVLDPQLGASAQDAGERTT